MKVLRGAVGLLLSVLVSVLAAGQTPTTDQLSQLKNLTPEQQQALLQSMGGDRSGATSGTQRSDQPLQNPQTVSPKSDRTQLYFDRAEREEREKAVDGRVLRQADEDPELRPEDTILIDIIPVELLGEGAQYPGGNSSANPQNGVNGQGAANGLGLNGATGLNGMAAQAGASRNNANGNTGAAAGIGAAAQGAYVAGSSSIMNPVAADNPIAGNLGQNRFADDAKAEAHRQKAEEFRQRILSNNPYKLNRYGALEVPGLPAIPLAGLTALEASRRLGGDPDLRDFAVKVTLLRLRPFGEDALKPFGYDLFEGVPSTFAPVSDIQVPTDYVVGPGDRLNVELYGNEPANYELTVQRDGRINLPKLGPVMVSGISFEAARAAIEQRVSQQLIGTRVSVTMGELRSIRVFVLGEAEKPGSYTVGALSTMTNALFVSGGVKKIGSLRNIELKRNGRLVTVLDLYDLLLHGDTSGDRQLMPGDVIFIPPIGPTVAVDGAVKRPAIYELKREKTASEAVELAGGLMPDADGRRVQIEHILPSRLRQMENVDLTTTAGLITAVGNGDKVRVPAILPTLENSVTLTGFVYRPGSFEFHPGLRLSDIITSFDELRPEADLHYVMIRRQIPPEERVAVVSADLVQALHARGAAADPPLQPRDRIYVFDLSASREKIVAPVIKDLELQGTPDKPAQVVSIDGKVKAPGRYPLEPNMHVSDLIRAGGSLEDNAYGGEAELTRYELKDGQSRQSELFTVNLSAIRRGVPGADLALRPYDVLIIKSVPLWDELGYITLIGEVRYPGKYPIHRGETLHSILDRAGGLNEGSFAEGAVFIRQELKERERQQLELLTNRFQRDLTSLSLEALSTSAASSNPNAANGAAQGIAIGQQLLEQLRNTKPVGRLVVDINQVLKHPPGSLGDVILRDGDELVIPKATQEITIMGEVQSPTSHVFRPGLSRDDYIAKSGGVTQKADRKRIYVVRANGDVVGGGRVGWFRRSQSVDIRPGDTIVVPVDAERVRALPLWTAVTTIIYNIAIALLAIRSV